MNNARRSIDPVSQWLIEVAASADTFGTLTFKQHRPVYGLGTVKLDVDEARRTIRLWLRRVDNDLFGNHADRRETVRRLIALEGGWPGQHLHAHFVASSPAGSELALFIAVLRDQWRRLDWAAPRCEIEPLKDKNAAIPYITKYGLDSIQLDLSTYPPAGR
jgi:hypothetical protein